MSRSIVVASFVSCALAFSLNASAQDPAAKKPDTSKPAAASGAKEHTMTGCLQKGSEPGTFTVQNTEAKGPKMIAILESKDKLDAHVGHKIAITGVDVPEKDAKSKAKADHYMKVSALKMVSQTCP